MTKHVAYVYVISSTGQTGSVPNQRGIFLANPLEIPKITTDSGTTFRIQSHRKFGKISIFYDLSPEKLIHNFIIFREKKLSAAIEVSKIKFHRLRLGGVPVSPVSMLFFQKPGWLGSAGTCKSDHQVPPPTLERFPLKIIIKIENLMIFTKTWVAWLSWDLEIHSFRNKNCEFPSPNLTKPPRFL